MSSSKESFLLIVVVNVVLSMCVFGVAFALFAPDGGAEGPSAATAGQGVESLRETVDALRAELALARKETESLRSEFGGMAGRVGKLETDPAGGREGAIFVSGGQPIEITPEMRMMIGVASVMMKGRVKAERNRFIDDVMKPTEKSEARKLRNIDRAVRHMKNRVDLDKAEVEEVTRILTQLEDGRRSRLKALIETKESRDDVEYNEVRRILEDSFVEEDRLIMQTLPPEKAVAYTETAEPFRTVIYGVARMAFPEPQDK